MEAFRVIEPGPFTTIQDLGRMGYEAFGVPVSGALDQFSSRIANWIVGNPAGAAVLETTFMGPKLEVLCEASVAVAGAEMEVTLNGVSIEMWTSNNVKPGDLLWLKRSSRGLRSYLAVTGGIDVPAIMGSRSTYVGAGLGGLYGRALAKGDVLKRGPGRLRTGKESLPPLHRPGFGGEITLRAVPGPQDDYFHEGLHLFFSATFWVTPQCDRMGYRLDGPAVPRNSTAPPSIISEPSLPGAIQIPPDGKPIILLVEQTVGGYPKIATVIWPDLPKVAQAKPKDQVRFEPVSLSQAHAIYRENFLRLEEIRRLFKAPA